MIVKPLREIYPVDTISQDKGWIKIKTALENLEDDIMIDFNGINVSEPWQCPGFKQLLKLKHIHMSFVNNEDMVNRIKMMCVMDGIDESKIHNIVVELPKEKTAEEKKIERYGTELIPYFNIEDNKACFNVQDKYSQLQSTNTIAYIEYAIRDIARVQGIKEFIINMGEIYVLDNVLQAIANVIVSAEADEITIQLDVPDNDTYKRFGLFMHIATNNKYDDKERVATLRKLLHKNTAGILIKYKKSKALDDFGRHGKGEVVSSRIAIFKGLKVTDHGIVAEIESYSDNKFFTRQHWMVEHDNECPSLLPSELTEIKMSELGYGDMYLGSQYHFLMPVQQNISENRSVIYDISDEGTNIKKICTIPERMKLVFDDWGIDYDKELLDKAIEDTKVQLSKESK